MMNYVKRCVKHISLSCDGLAILKFMAIQCSKNPHRIKASAKLKVNNK